MATTAVGIQCKPIIIQLRASIALPPPPPSLSLPPIPHGFHSTIFFSLPFNSLGSSVPHQSPPTSSRRATPTDDDMSHRLGRVVSDLSHSNSRSMTDHSLHHHQSATCNNNEGGNAGKAKPKLSLLISSVVSWTRSESSGDTSSRERNSSSSKQQQANGGRGRGLEIVLAVRKYVAMVVEQLFTSPYSASSSRDVDSRRRDAGRRQERRPHTFTSARHAGGNANAAAQAQSSKRHRGRLSSAPASLRGSPATSGHLSVGESVAKASTSSEVSTMEELQSAIQAAIAHCKNSVAGGGGDKQQQQQQQRKC